MANRYILKNAAGNGEMPFETKEERDSYYEANKQYWQAPTDGTAPATTRRYTGEAAATTPATDADPVASYYEGIKNKSAMPDEARRQSLRSEAERDVQTQIEAIRGAYNTIIADERARQQESAQLGKRQVSGIGRLSGLGGSSVQAGRQIQQKTMAQEKERQAVAVLQAQQAKEEAAARGSGIAAAEARFLKEQEIAAGYDQKYGEYLQGLGKTAKEAITTLSPGESAYNANGDLIAHNPANATEGKNVVLNEGDTLVDAAGKVIARGSPKTVDDKSNELLTPTEAAALGVAYGTTRGQAATMGLKPTGDMNAAQLKSYEGITTRYQADGVLQNVNNAAIGAAIADQVIKNPGNAANQLKSLYILVKALDPNSAVREGEIGLAESTQSYLQRFGTAITRLGEGQTIDPQTAVQLANATKELFGVWQQVGQRRVSGYKAQAQGLNVGDAFDRYLASSTSVAAPYSPNAPTASPTPSDPAFDALRNDPDLKGYSDDQIRSMLGKNNVGTDTNKGAPAPASISVSIPASSRLAKVNNNPGNVRYVGQPGATPGEGGFARFPTPQAGYQALWNDIKAKQTGRTRTGLGPNSTLRDLIYVYAPPIENNSAQYVQQLASRLGVSPTTPIGQLDTHVLAKEIARKESSTVIG